MLRFEERVLDAGENTWVWCPLRSDGRKFPAGVYFAVVEGGGRQASARLVLLSP